MKKCNKCGLEKPPLEFSKNSSKKDGLQTICKSCKNLYNKNHYVSNRQYHIDRSARRNREQRQILSNYKESNPCEDCGIYYPSCVMDFDHKNPALKLFNVNASLVGKNLLWKEIEKCDLVCANCHRIRTHM